VREPFTTSFASAQKRSRYRMQSRNKTMYQQLGIVNMPGQ
jgi:hypothetical protein